MSLGQRHPTPMSLPGESHGQRSLTGYSPWGRTQLKRVSARAHTHTHTHACTGGSRDDPAHLLATLTCSGRSLGVTHLPPGEPAVLQGQPAPLLGGQCPLVAGEGLGQGLVPARSSGDRKAMSELVKQTIFFSSVAFVTQFLKSSPILLCPLCPDPSMRREFHPGSLGTALVLYKNVILKGTKSTPQSSNVPLILPGEMQTIYQKGVRRQRIWNLLVLM